MAELDLLIGVMASISALVGFSLAIPVLVQFVNNVSRNMSQTNTNVTEEITKLGKQG